MYQRPSNGRFGLSSAPASSRGPEPLPVAEVEEDDAEAKIKEPGSENRSLEQLEAHR